MDSDYNQQQEDLTLNGTSGVTSVNTYRRVYRAFILTAGSGNTNVGTLTIRHTTTTGNVFSVIPIGYGQALLTAYTIPAGYTGYMRRYIISMLDTTSNQAAIAIWRRDNGGAVRLTRPLLVNTSSPTVIDVYGGVRFSEKCDLIFRALSVLNTNADISVQYDLLLVANQS